MTEKDKKAALLILLLAPILLFLVWKNIFLPQVQEKTASRAILAERVLQERLNNQLADQKGSPQATVKSIQSYREGAWNANPFFEPMAQKPFVEQKSPQAKPRTIPIPRFHLEGIVWDPMTPYAIIDGEVREVGDVIQSFTVTFISRDEVTLTRGDDTVNLRLFPENF